MSVNCSHKQQLAVTARVSLLKVSVGSCLSSPLSQPLLSESSFFQGERIADEDVVSLNYSASITLYSSGTDCHS